MLANNAFASDFFDRTAAVGNYPMSVQQLAFRRADIADDNGIGENIAFFRRRGLRFYVFGGYRYLYGFFVQDLFQGFQVIAARCCASST